jgi:hypothetical protein
LLTGKDELTLSWMRLQAMVSTCKDAVTDLSKLATSLESSHDEVSRFVARVCSSASRLMQARLETANVYCAIAVCTNVSDHVTWNRTIDGILAENLDTDEAMLAPLFQSLRTELQILHELLLVQQSLLEFQFKVCVTGLYVSRMYLMQWEERNAGIRMVTALFPTPHLWPSTRSGGIFLNLFFASAPSLRSLKFSAGSSVSIKV